MYGPRRLRTGFQDHLTLCGLLQENTVSTHGPQKSSTLLDNNGMISDRMSTLLPQVRYYVVTGGFYTISKIA